MHGSKESSFRWYFHSLIPCPIDLFTFTGEKLRNVILVYLTNLFSLICFQISVSGLARSKTWGRRPLILAGMISTLTYVCLRILYHICTVQLSFSLENHKKKQSRLRAVRIKAVGPEMPATLLRVRLSMRVKTNGKKKLVSAIVFFFFPWEMKVNILTANFNFLLNCPTCESTNVRRAKLVIR